MKRIFLTGLFASLIAVACFAQKPYKVVFYNFENLFDTIHDPGVLDEEFTPEGPKKWNSAKYTRKIGNLERVLFDIAAEDKDYPVVIGVSEIENRSVMEDVIAQPKLAPGNYRIVHYDSPDARGVDVAFYYRPDVFKLEGSAAIPFKMPELPNFRTRDFVTMWGTIDSEPFFFLVSHWPSRLGGKEASAPKRLAAAKQVKHIVDSVTAANPATKVVVMGDLNDDATDDSIVEGLNAKGKPWVVGIDRPKEGNFTPGADLQVKISLSGKGLATSGNYRKFRTDSSGRKIVHTVDPRTGQPVTSDLLSATVVAETSAEADAYGTALMVMGLERGKEFLAAHPEIQAYLIYSDEQGRFQTYVTPELGRTIAR